MADAGFFKGTSADQDRRFSDKELKLLKTMKFPPEFDKKVDMRKVNLSVIRPWIVKKVVELVGFEDEVVVEYAMGLLEDDSQPTPDPRRMQINLTGFLTNSTPAFMSALWKLLLEAQESPAGVPRTFVEEKKEEMRQAKAGDSRAIEERDRRARLDEIRANERDARGGGRDLETAGGVIEAGDPEGHLGARAQLPFPFPLSNSSASVPFPSARWSFPVPHPASPQALASTSVTLPLAVSSAPEAAPTFAHRFPSTFSRQASEGLPESATTQAPHLSRPTLAFPVT
ncbi:PWI domain-containing protein [Trametes polyzona]|nr:PWI domain-containing protein [Trametes polyzona]